MEPTTITCSVSPCEVTLTHVVEVAPFNLDAAGGAAVAVAILAVWAVGFAFRALIRSVNVDQPTRSDSSDD